MTGSKDGPLHSGPFFFFCPENPPNFPGKYRFKYDMAYPALNRFDSETEPILKAGSILEAVCTVFRIKYAPVDKVMLS